MDSVAFTIGRYLCNFRTTSPTLASTTSAFSLNFTFVCTFSSNVPRHRIPALSCGYFPPLTSSCGTPAHLQRRDEIATRNNARIKIPIKCPLTTPNHPPTHKIWRPLKRVEIRYLFGKCNNFDHFWSRRLLVSMDAASTVGRWEEARNMWMDFSPLLVLCNSRIWKIDQFQLTFVRNNCTKVVRTSHP